MDNDAKTEALIDAELDGVADEIAKMVRWRKALRTISEDERRRFNPQEREDYTNEVTHVRLRLYELCHWVVELGDTDWKTLPTLLGPSWVQRR